MFSINSSTCTAPYVSSISYVVFNNNDLVLKSSFSCWSVLFPTLLSLFEYTNQIVVPAINAKITDIIIIILNCFFFFCIT